MATLGIWTTVVVGLVASCATGKLKRGSGLFTYDNRPFALQKTLYLVKDIKSCSFNLIQRDFINNY